MQVFRYMVFIWEDYEKEMEKKHRGISKTKNFLYPPVLPIVFYDGADNWTAATRLHDRIFLSDVYGKYVPDYQCVLVQLKDYSNAELMKKKDELSVLMMVDRLRNAADYMKLGEEVGNAYLSEVTMDSPEYLLDIMAQIIEVFLTKLNLPQDEVDSFRDQIKEKRMGELFAHFEGWDVQAIRKEEREKAAAEVAEAKKRATQEVTKQVTQEVTKQVTQQVTQQVTKQVTQQVTQQVTNADIEKLIKAIRKLTGSKEDAKQQVMEQYHLTKEEAGRKVEACWDLEKAETAEKIET
jgi:HSP90 family molecular chaperone